MARRRRNFVRPAARPGRPQPKHPLAREWTVSGLRLSGSLKLPSPAAEAWTLAWRRFENGDAGCPIDEEVLESLIAAWPSRAEYSAVMAAWRAPMA